MNPLLQICDQWQRFEHFLLTAHANPDGDAVGSLSGLANLLARLGKAGHILLPEGLPDRFSWLNLPWPVVSHLPKNLDQCIVVLDCADLDRLGEDLAARIKGRKLINIDHHTGNSFFGALNWVDPGLSSVGEMIAVAARSLEVPINGPLAEGLYLAIMADTGSLTFSNTTPQTLDVIAEILANGLDLDNFQAKMQRQWSLPKLFLHGMAMQNVSIRANGKIGIIRATEDMLDQTGAVQEDCDGLVEYVRRLQGVIVAVSLREVANGVKFSMRTWGEVNVQAMAAQLGGGGHPNAAGGHINKNIVQAEELIVQTITSYIAKQ
jgi:phosphoesterase RecJ-like protein